MANPRAFISFDFDNDSLQRILFVGQISNSRTPFNVEDWSSKTVLPEKQWEDLIKIKVNKCNLLIVLVGRKTYTAQGVVKEIAFAKDQLVPVFGVYVDGANSLTTLPSGLQRNRTITWSWVGIASIVEQSMGEGKNIL